MSVLMTLGDIRFSVADGAYQTLHRALEVRVARMERARGQAARQVLGYDETVEIEGVCYPGQRHARDRVDSFRALARAQEAVLLTDGTGAVWGRWIVERVDERGSAFMEAGVPMRQEFRLALGAAPEDRT